MATEDFGKRILSIRQNANMTQEEFAMRMGVTPPGDLQVGEGSESAGYFHPERFVQGVECEF